MAPGRFVYLWAAVIGFAVSGMVSAGSVAGIARTDDQPLERGPFESQPGVNGTEIMYEFEPMYLTAEANTWTKTFRWVIPANTGLVPGETLRIEESIPLIYPTGVNPLFDLRISDWHEMIASGDLSNFFEWDSQSIDTSVRALLDGQEVPIHSRIDFSSDGKSLSFDFDALTIPTQDQGSNPPLILEIVKDVRWIGPVLDPLSTSHYIDVPVSEYPSTPALLGDFNGNGVVDAGDFLVWRKGIDTAYTQSDYNVWRSHFRQTASSGSGAVTNAAVPEPASIVMLINGTVAM